MAAILDHDGDVVWWFEQVAGLEEGQIMRALLSRDRRSVYFLSMYDHIVRADIDGSSFETFNVPGAHHDMVELDDGTLAVLAQEAITVGATDDVLADTIELLHPDGTLERFWSSWDEFEPDLTTPDGGTFGYLHLNAIDFVPEQDALYVSSLHLQTILQIDRSAREVHYQIGGAASGVALADGESLFDLQHQFQVLPDGILVFVNGDLDEAMTSSAVEYQLDRVSGSAVESWGYTADPAFFSPVQGDVQRLDDGSTVVVWSPQGRVDRVDDRGELLWSASMPLGYAMGYGSWLPEVVD